MRRIRFFYILIAFLFISCPAGKDSGRPQDIIYQSEPVSTFWKNATVYFLLTDRFHNGDPSNDLQYERRPDGAVMRSFAGGDLAGITKKIEEGYFDSLGVNAIWLTPVFEQIAGHTDEGTGKTYAYHGYWTRDWTAIDPNFGTEAELKQMVDKAHEHGIRVLLDAVVNHTGPVTPIDPVWPEEWVRTAPTCKYQDFQSTVECTLVKNLPDVRTEAVTPVSLPSFLEEKWEKEGRLEREKSELETFFAETGYPRLNFYYIIKWLMSWVKKMGIDGFRVDTAKHTEAYVWSVLKKECEKALEIWREENPDMTIHSDPFYMTGEVYGYGVSSGRSYHYGDQSVDFFSHGFESLINFEFKSDAKNTYEEIFSKYNRLLNDSSFTGLSVLNYLSSHDDGDPFDRERSRAFESATKLLLTQGAAQIYYGDELARPLQVEGANGDANLRSFMNWEDLITKAETRELLMHWKKLGRFRSLYPAVGAGEHQKLSDSPYTFQRSLGDDFPDRVVVGLDYPEGEKIIDVAEVYPDGTLLKDFYSGIQQIVSGGQIKLDSPYQIVLLGVM